jgi:hypothetical protein
MPDDDGEGGLEGSLRRVDEHLERVGARLDREMERMNRQVERIFAAGELRTIESMLGAARLVPPRPPRPPRAPIPPRAPTPPARVEPHQEPPTPRAEEAPVPVAKSLWEHLEDDADVATPDAELTSPTAPRGFWAKMRDLL